MFIRRFTIQTSIHQTRHETGVWPRSKPDRKPYSIWTHIAHLNSNLSSARLPCEVWQTACLNRFLVPRQKGPLRSVSDRSRDQKKVKKSARAALGVFQQPRSMQLLLGLELALSPRDRPVA